MDQAQIELNVYSPYSAQIPIHESNARFKTAACGRRFGKTTMALGEYIATGCNQPQATCWWVAPTYKVAKRAFRILERGLPREVVKDKSKVDFRYELLNGSELEFKSADNPDSLREGQGINYLVVEEAAQVDEECWDRILRPSLADAKGKAMFIGTPKGRNWFYRLYARGMDPAYPEYASFKLPSWLNPFVFPEGPDDPEIAEIKASMSIDMFRQEIEAEFLEDSAGVFRNITACIRGEVMEPQPDRTYYGGWDIARLQDFSVITIRDDKGRFVFQDRFNKIDWKAQRARVIAASRRYNNCQVLVDETGIGDVVFEELKREGLNCRGFKFTQQSKNDLVQEFAVALEQGEPSIPESMNVFIDELKFFSYKLGKGGRVSYSAPPGYNDDCVDSALLAWRCGRFRSRPKPFVARS